MKDRLEGAKATWMLAWTIASTRYWSERKFGGVGRLRAAYIGGKAAVEGYVSDKREGW